MTININSSEIQHLALAFPAPKGSIFMYKGALLRGFLPEHAEFYADLIDSSLFASLRDRGMIIDAAPVSGYAAEGFELLIQHASLGVQSYCFEWTPGMLRDAALLVLETEMELHKNSLCLQRVSPYTIAYDYYRPRLIDIGAIGPRQSGLAWAAYDEYRRCYLYPLMLDSAGHMEETRAFLRNTAEGGLDDAGLASTLELAHKLRPIYVRHVLMPRLRNLLRSDRHQPGVKAWAQARPRTDTNYRKIRQFIFTLKEEVSSLRVSINRKPAARTRSRNDEDLMAAKRNVLTDVFDALKPKSVLVFCGRPGILNGLDALTRTNTIALGHDFREMDALYARAKEQQLRILTLCTDSYEAFITDEKPGLEPPDERLSGDLLVVLDLIPHLVLSEDLTFTSIIKLIKRFRHTWLMIEYSGHREPGYSTQPPEAPDHYPWYTYENFLAVLGEFYNDVKVLKKLDSSGYLILCRA